MRGKVRKISKFFAATALWCGAAGAVLAQKPMAGTVMPFAAVTFAPDGDVACLASALETGTAATGPSTWILKAPPGCVVPWHSHTAQEQFIVVFGDVKAEMPGHPPTRLGPGGFAAMGSHMAHQLTCEGTVACVVFASFDRAYDIKWEKAQP